MSGVKLETWKGKKVVVARNKKGQILDLSRKKDTNIAEIRERFKKTGSVRKNITKKREKLTNFTEVIQTAPTNENRKPKARLSRPKAALVQYVVSGIYQGNKVTARSQKIGGNSLINTAKGAKDQAWNNFLSRLGEIADPSAQYDADTGKQVIDKVRNLREGWVYYT